MALEIIRPGARFDFIGKWRICAVLSLALLAAGAAGLATRGVQWGLDFAGGTETQVRFTKQNSGEGEIRAALNASPLGYPGLSVVRYGEGRREFLIKFGGPRRAEGTPAQAEPTPQNDRVLALHSILEKEIGALQIDRTEYVGPKVGAELREAGAQAMGLATALILVYLALRFSARFAPGAVVALLHDVLITCGIWVLCGFEFDLRVLAALLAIIGYSLNDTIIVYDRVRENLARRTRVELQDVLNEAVNQTLSRTLLTSLTTLAAVLSLLFLGGEVIRPFALAMAIGVVVGTYSSMFVAAPTFMWLERRFGGESA